MGHDIRSATFNICIAASLLEHLFPCTFYFIGRIACADSLFRQFFVFSPKQVPNDPYTTHQRLAVVFALLFSTLAVNAMFFGAKTAADFNATVSV
jgi:hypothetical protein